MIEYIVFIVETTLLAGLVIYLVREYSAKDVPTYVQILTYVSWFFTFIVFIILPIDIANSYRESLNSNALYNEADDYLYVLWRVLYWINFSLSWVILPLFQDYEDSGEFTVKRKLISSLKKNLIIYATGLTLGLLLIFYLAFSKKLSILAIEGILAGLGNTLYKKKKYLYSTSGIFLVILLLGYGFVAIPKKYIKESDEEKILIQYYCLASEIDERRTEDLYELEEKYRVFYQY